MSPFPHYEIARRRQQEIVSPAINSDRSNAERTAFDWQRSVKRRLVPVVVALGVCGAAGTGVGVSDAQSNQSSPKQHGAHISAQQLERKIQRFERKGFVPSACTVKGTLMRNYSTGQSVTVTW